MITWKLERFAYTSNGTFGILRVPNLDKMYTIEQDWENNKPSHSCIPCGTYGMSMYFSPGKQTEVLLLHNDGLLSQGAANGAPRTYIEFHVANWMKDVKGCIGPGDNLGNSWNVTNSKKSMHVLLRAFYNNEARISISNSDMSHNGISF